MTRLGLICFQRAAVLLHHLNLVAVVLVQRYEAALPVILMGTKINDNKNKKCAFFKSEHFQP
jgi:hypothetical protein